MMASSIKYFILFTASCIVNILILIKKILYFYLQCIGQSFEITKSYVPLRSLNHANICTMNPRSICKLLLGDTEFLSSLLDFKTKLFEKIYICLHTLIIVYKIIVNAESLQHTIISIICKESFKSENCKMRQADGLTYSEFPHRFLLQFKGGGKRNYRCIWHQQCRDVPSARNKRQTSISENQQRKCNPSTRAEDTSLQTGESMHCNFGLIRLKM